MNGEGLPKTTREVLEHFRPGMGGLTEDNKEFVREFLPAHLFVVNRENRHHAWCSHCREWVDLPKSYHKETVECPSCGKEAVITHTWRGYKRLCDRALIYFYDKSIKDRQILTSKAVYIEYKWYREENGEPVGPWDIKPYIKLDSAAVYMYGRGSAAIRPMGGSRCYATDKYMMTRGKAPRWSAYSDYISGCANTNFGIDEESIDKAVEGTPFRYVWDSARNELQKYGNRSCYLGFFARLSSYPFAVEALAKAGPATQEWLYGITEQGQCNYGIINWRGRSWNKVFRYSMTKEEKRWLHTAELQWGRISSVLMGWQYLKSKGINNIPLWEVENLKMIEPGSMDGVGKLIRLDRLAKYLHRQQEKHPKIDHRLDTRITFDYYRDYLRLCQNLHVPMDSKNRIKPRDLVEAHDLMQAEWDRILELQAEEERQKRAAQQRKEIKGKNKMWAKLRKSILRTYRFEADGMMIYVPKRLEELVDEGVAMHSCVGSYVDRVARGMAIIVFIRAANDHSRRIGTVEISADGASIIQARAKFNRNLPPEAQAFVEKFVAVKIKGHRERMTA